METAARSLGLDFGSPCYAVQLRITPQLKEALLNAKAAGHPTQMRLDQGAGAIIVGDQEFAFKANDETCCDLLRLPVNADGQPAEEVAQIRQKLHIQRTLDEEERRRARERRLMAEEQQNTRTMQRLENLPAPVKGPQKLKKDSAQAAAQAAAPQKRPAAAQQRPSAAAPKPPSAMYHRPSTPPVSRGPTPPPPGALGPGSRGLTPPLPSTTGRPNGSTDGVVRSGTPPVGAIGPKAPKSKSNALLSKLGGKGGSAAGRPAPAKNMLPRSKEPPPPAAILGARKSVAVCLLGLLSERDFRRPAQVEQALAEVAARVPGFKPPTGQALTDQLKRVAIYKSPGIYVVLQEFQAQAQELKKRAEIEIRGDTPDSLTPSRSTSPDVPPATQQQQQPQQKKIKQQQQQGAGKGTGRGKQPTPEPQRRPAQAGAAPRPSAADRAPAQSTPEPLLQLVEDDLGIPSSQRPRPLPSPRAAEPGKVAPRLPGTKTKASAASALLQGQGAGGKRVAGAQQQGKTPAGKMAAVKAKGKQAAAKPEQQRLSGMLPPSKQPPAAVRAKPVKRSRAVLEESDDDSGDEWTPDVRSRAHGSSEEAGSGSGGSGFGRPPARGSNTTSSMPPRSSPSSEEPADIPQQQQQKKQRIEATLPMITELPRAPSALASSNCADDSWFAAYETRQPIQHLPVADTRQYKEYCEEYSAKFDVYHKLHQEMSTVTRYVKALKEGAQSAASEAGRREYGAQAERLYLRTQTLMQRWASAFKVLHAELEDLFNKLNEYREAALKGSLSLQANMPVSHALAV